MRGRSAQANLGRSALGLCVAVLMAACPRDAPNASSEASVPPTGTSSSAPAPPPSPSPGTVVAALPDGRYVLRAPITRAEAIAHGLRGDDVAENLGRFTLELQVGAFTLSQRPPKPVEFPLIIGSYAWTQRGLVLTPSTFRGQVWILQPTRLGDRVTFVVVHTESSFAPSHVRAGVTTIFETHAWRLGA